MIGRYVVELELVLLQHASAKFMQCQTGGEDEEDEEVQRTISIGVRTPYMLGSGKLLCFLTTQRGWYPASTLSYLRRTYASQPSIHQIINQPANRNQSQESRIAANDQTFPDDGHGTLIVAWGGEEKRGHRLVRPYLLPRLWLMVAFLIYLIVRKEP